MTANVWCSAILLGKSKYLERTVLVWGHNDPHFNNKLQIDMKVIKSFVKLDILNRNDAFELPLEPRNYKDVKDVLCGPNTEAYSE